MYIEFMRKVFNLTNRYVILITVLILYSLVTNVYAAFFMAGNTKFIGLILAVIILILMSAVFTAGWCKMVVAAIDKPESDEPNALIKIFPEGVGEYILPILGSLLVLAVFFCITLGLTFHAGSHFIGNPHIDISKLAKIGNDMTAAKSFMDSLSPVQIKQLLRWNQLFLLYLTSVYFLLFLYLPAIFYKCANPFKAFFISLKDLFSKKILKTTGIFFAVFLANMLISMLTAIFSSNTIMSFLVTLLGFYIFTASVVGIFYYYNENFVKSYLGQNIDIKI